MAIYRCLIDLQDQSDPQDPPQQLQDQPVHQVYHDPKPIKSSEDTETVDKVINLPDIVPDETSDHEPSVERSPLPNDGSTCSVEEVDFRIPDILSGTEPGPIKVILPDLVPSHQTSHVVEEMNDSGIICDISDEDENLSDDQTPQTKESGPALVSEEKTRWRLIGRQLNLISGNLAENESQDDPSTLAYIVSNLAASAIANTVLYYCIKKIINIF